MAAPKSSLNSTEGLSRNNKKNIIIGYLINYSNETTIPASLNANDVTDVMQWRSDTAHSKNGSVKQIHIALINVCLWVFYILEIIIYCIHTYKAHSYLTVCYVHVYRICSHVQIPKFVCVGRRRG